MHLRAASCFQVPLTHFFVMLDAITNSCTQDDHVSCAVVLAVRDAQGLNQELVDRGTKKLHEVKKVCRVAVHTRLCGTVDHFQ